jgi:hypothetical protein
MVASNIGAGEIAAGVRTVEHVELFFSELKVAAQQLAQSGSAGQRGYFTPGEQESIQALLVSYWQARNALFDLISHYRRNLQHWPAEQRPLAVLTALAAALVLVDAARFLRDLAEQRPHLKRKLNEAAAEFSIPAGCYDQIQRSLLSARHAWHLYHALRSYEQSRDQWKAAAEAAAAAGVVQIIDRLLERTDVGVWQYTRARLRTRGGQIARRFTADVLAAALYGLQKLGGSLVADKYVRRGHHPLLPAAIADSVRRLLQPGDVLIVRKEYALTNYFLPGFWPHAALYLGTTAELERLGLPALMPAAAHPAWRRLLDRSAAAPDPAIVLESMRDGVLFRSLASPFASDSIVVLRPQLTLPEIAAGLSRGLVHEGKPYDFDFDFRRADRLVCTEVVYRSFDGLGRVRFPLVRRAGRPTLSGSDLIRMAVAGQNLDPVAVFASRISGSAEVITGPRVTDILRQAERLEPAHER